MNDEDHENKEEEKDTDESEEDVYGVTTVINFQKHQVGDEKLPALTESVSVATVYVLLTNSLIS